MRAVSGFLPRHIDDLDAAVLGSTRLLRVLEMALAEPFGDELAGIDAESRDQKLPHRFRPLLGKLLVIVGSALGVGMPADQELPVRQSRVDRARPRGVRVSMAAGVSLAELRSNSTSRSTLGSCLRSAFSTAASTETATALDAGSVPVLPAASSGVVCFSTTGACSRTDAACPLSWCPCRGRCCRHRRLFDLSRDRLRLLHLLFLLRLHLGLDRRLRLRRLHGRLLFLRRLQLVDQVLDGLSLGLGLRAPSSSCSDGLSCAIAGMIEIVAAPIAAASTRPTVIA